MNTVLKGVFELRIQGLLDTAFQGFIDEFYLVAHGTDFTPIKQKRDKGCDGILFGDTILAVYAPEKYELKAFEKKYGDDYENYCKNWAAKYPKWRVVYNGDILATGQQFLSSLKDDVEIIQRSHICDQIADLSWTQKKKLGRYLGIDDQYFVNDALEEIIDDLASGAPEGGVSYQSPMYMPEKVALNFDSEDADTILSEYSSYMSYFDSLKGLLSIDDSRATNLKSRVCTDYMRRNGSCKERLTGMTDEYAGKKGVDDEYKKLIRVILIYFFEQCLIGQRTEIEKHA